MGKVLGVIIALVVVVGAVWLLSDDETTTDSSGDYVSQAIAYDNLRDTYTHLQGNGADTTTLMIYMVGSDLESEGGCASEDLQEIMDGEIGDQLNIIVQTGGSYGWYNEQISADTVQRFKVTNDGLNLLGDVGDRNMADPNTLSSFIRDTSGQFPADRYMLIFWNHGGGTMAGYGYDEKYEDMLSLASINSALQQAGTKFDFVAFDACLMATMETAFVMEKHADYLIASEETEPGVGWYYTDWITRLSQEPSIPTVDLGTQIVDDFVANCSWLDDTTLSITDLREIPFVYNDLCDYLAVADQVLIDNRDYQSLSTARSEARAYGDGEYEQIDTVDYIKQTGMAEGDDLIAAINSAVKYCNGSVENSNGLAMYFPYTDPSSYSDVAYMIRNLGMNDQNYVSFFDNFLSVMAGSQMSTRSRSPIQTLTGAEAQTTDYNATDWYDPAVSAEYQEDYSQESFGTQTENGQLFLTEQGDNFILKLTDEEWEKIVDIELQVWLDDGEGYIDLGSDSSYTFDEAGNLVANYDNLWVALDGQIVPFYTEVYEEKEDGSWYNYGYVPCFINDEYKELVIYWTNEKPDGYVAGYRHEMGGQNAASKGLTALKNGDVIEAVCDCYTYDGEYDDYYLLGDAYTYDGNNLVVSYEDVGESDCLVYYMLTDFYQNNFWTEPLNFSLQE